MKTVSEDREGRELQEQRRNRGERTGPLLTGRCQEAAVILPDGRRQ
jgi:hypothetical protein